VKQFNNAVNNCNRKFRAAHDIEASELAELAAFGSLIARNDRLCGSPNWPQVIRVNRATSGTRFGFLFDNLAVEFMMPSPVGVSERARPAQF
jgi:hypothetical protein